MQRNVLELRCGRDVLLLVRRGALPNTPMIAGKHRHSQSALDRFLALRTNLDLLRRRWRVLQPSPTLAWHSDGDLKRMLKAAIESGRIDMVLVPTGESRARVDIRPFVEKARKAAADRQAAAQPARLQGGAQRSQMVTPISVSVANWPLEQRVEEVARRAGRKVPGEAGQALKQLVSPEAIGLMAGLITVGALAQLTPFGWVADAAIIGIAFVFGGLAAVHALGDIIECFDLTNTAKSDADLERASEALSRAIVGIGLVALIALLHRFAKGSEKGAPKAGPKPGPTEAEKIAALRSAKPVEQVKPMERAKPVEKAKAQPGDAKSAPQDMPANPAVEKRAAPPAKTQLTDQGIKDKFAKEIEDCKSFKTQGVSRDQADRFLQTAEGQEYLESLRAASPNASADTIYARAVDQISTFSEVPKFKEISEPLIKMVPKGTDVSQYSPFFTTRAGLEEAKASGKGLADYFGLPIKSEALQYDIFEIAPKGQQKVLVGPLAPTTELGGLVTKNGGALQTVVPNRGNWSKPQRVGETEN